MKKRCLSLLLLFLAFSLCCGQSTITPVISFQKQLTLKRATAAVFVIPSVGIKKGSNTILAGPVIRIAQLDNVLPDKPIFTGFQVTQQHFFTIQDTKKLRFFGEFNSKYQEMEEEWTSNYWNANQGQYIDNEAESEETVWENSLGAGIGWNFHSNFYLQSSLGLGYYLSFLESDAEDGLSDLPNTKDYRGYRNKGIFYSFQIGVAYKLSDISKSPNLFGLFFSPGDK